MAKYLQYLNVLILIISFSFTNACNKRDTLTSVSYSDNKSFNKRGYAKNSPLRPIGNLVNDKDMKNEDIEFYQYYVSSGYYTLEENDKYFIWLNNQRTKRLEKGKENKFKQETMPGLNTYYMERTRTFKGNNISVAERRYIDTIIKLNEAEKSKQIQKDLTITKDDEISDYNILNYKGEKDKSTIVSYEEYE